MDIAPKGLQIAIVELTKWVDEKWTRRSDFADYQQRHSESLLSEL